MSGNTHSDGCRFASRSQAVCHWLERVVRDARADEIDNAFTEGFRRIPERPEELAEAERLSRQSILDEPWDRWW
jgi:hypothetical protein